MSCADATGIPITSAGSLMRHPVYPECAYVFGPPNTISGKRTRTCARRAFFNQKLFMKICEPLAPAFDVHQAWRCGGSGIGAVDAYRTARAAGVSYRERRQAVDDHRRLPSRI